jgi:prepilin-type N-terminal cleavage/methylation domain-containing protein
MQLTTTKLRHSGVTLIEVLVAIFVASIGLLALMALFPVGALSMRQALKDSRCAQTSANAFALFKALNIGQNLSSVTTDPFNDSVTVANFGTRPALGTNGLSYPVYIDPLGASIKLVNVNPPACLPVLTTSSYPFIMRSGVNLQTPIAVGPISSLPQYLQLFSLHDDIEFDPTSPGQPGAAGVMRDARYTFAYMVRRPYPANATCLDVTIVVYAGRPLSPTMGSYEEMACNQVIFSAGSTQVTVPYGGQGLQLQRPPIKPGSWILDATMPQLLANNQLDTTVVPQGYFYRVVDVIDNAGSLTLELQSPARQSTTAAQGMLIYLDNVAEVFEKGTVSLQ